MEVLILLQLDRVLVELRAILLACTRLVLILLQLDRVLVEHRRGPNLRSPYLVLILLQLDRVLVVVLPNFYCIERLTSLNPTSAG